MQLYNTDDTVLIALKILEDSSYWHSQYTYDEDTR